MSRDILSMTFGELTDAFTELGIQKFRAKQVYEWLHKHLASDYDEMLNIPKSLRTELSEKLPLYTCKIARKQVSKLDSTVKYLFEMHDGDFVESVVMKYKYGYTICVSSQVGCKMGCAFCASTLGGFKRSLLPGEILSQLYTAQKDLGERISHIVLMGMGEPLDNFENVVRFLNMVSDSDGLNISGRNISLSTCGIVPKIFELSELDFKLTLSVSLHAPTDELRSSMMPINKKYPISALMDACRSYTKTTGRRISFEYTLIKGVNDSKEQAEKLCSLLKGMLCHVNLIPVNSIKDSEYEKSEKQSIEAFRSYIESKGISATVRRKLGDDINAACGQLRRESVNE